MPDTFHSLQEQRSQAKTPHARYHKPWFKKPNKVNLLFIASNTLLIITLIIIAGIFGPVLAEEGKYQVRLLAESLSGKNIRGWVLPDWSVELVSTEVIEQNGIVIPKLFIQERIIPNIDSTDKVDYLPALREGIAHAAGTGLPGSGQLGYYFAHSSGASSALSRGKAVFYLLGKLDLGDEVQIYQDGQKYTYEVVHKTITEPDDLSFLDQEGDKIVLQTCWPVGTSKNRLIITAERKN